MTRYIFRFNWTYLFFMAPIRLLTNKVEIYYKLYNDIVFIRNLKMHFWKIWIKRESTFLLFYRRIGNYVGLRKRKVDQNDKAKTDGKSRCRGD